MAKKIIVIGSGFGGIAAALRLRAKKHNGISELGSAWHSEPITVPLPIFTP